MKLPPNYGHRYASSFEQMFLEVASDSGVAVLPFMLDGIATDSELMQGDGIHPTAAAQPRIMELVWSQLEDLLVARSRVP